VGSTGPDAPPSGASSKATRRTLIDRLASMRHAEADERMVRLMWKSELAALAILELIMGSTAVLLLRPDPPMFWFFVVGCPAAGMFVGYMFMRGIGAFGHYPTGLWGEMSRRAFHEGQNAPTEQAHRAERHTVD